MSPVPRWKTWLGLLMVVPLAAGSGALLYGLYRHLDTGQLETVVKGYGYTGRTVVFADRPGTFVFFFVMHALFALALVAVTVLVARLSVRRLRTGHDG